MEKNKPIFLNNKAVNDIIYMAFKHVAPSNSQYYYGKNICIFIII